MKAIRGEDRSQASGQAQVQVPHDPVDLAPSNVTATLADGGGVTLGWSAPAEDADNVTGYEILRAVGQGEMATLAADPASTATSYTDATATEAGETYAYQVKAIRGSDVSQASGQAQVQVPHAPVDLAPTGLTAALAEGGGVALTWEAPAEDAGSVTGYEILRAVGEGEPATLAADTGGTATTYTDATATEAGEAYTYQVKAIRGEDRSQASGQAQVQVPHDPVDLAPSNLTATLAEGGGVALSWTAPAEDAGSVTGYEILRAVGEGDMATLVDDTGNTATAYTDTTATEAGETHAYKVKAIRGEDRSQASGQAQVQLPHDPVDLAPSDLTAEAVDGGGVSLSWTAPAEDADSVIGYEVLRAVGEGDMATLAADPASTATSYTDATATEAGETYAYQVKAIRGEDRSQASGQAQVQIPHDPADLRPTGLTVSLVENKVTLSWTAPQANAETVDGYEILRRRPNQGESSLATLVADTESTATTYTDATANEPGVRYVYRVKALRGDDVSLWSSFDRIDLPADYAPDPTPTPEPESTSDDQAPAGLTAALAEGGGVALTWTAPAEDADGVTGYEVLRAVGGGEMATLAADTGSTATSYTDATATDAGETYAYQVKAIRGEDRSRASGQARVQLPHDPVDLAPSNLTAEAVDSGVNLSWTAPAEDADSVTGYEILRAVGDGELATLAADTGFTATRYTDVTATQSGTSYTYKVKAIRGEDRSQASGEAQVQLPNDADDQAPSGLSAALAEGGGVALTWTAPAEDADGVTGYKVLRAVGDGEFATLVDDTGSTATSYTDATATDAGETYAYQVKAIRGDDRSEASGQAQVQVPHDAVDLAPTGLTAVVLTASLVVVGEKESTPTTSVRLSWTAPAEDAGSVTGYEILRAVGEGDMATLVDDTGNAATTYTDTTATEAGETYAYKVKAIRGEDRSQASGRAQVQLPHDAVDLAPSDLTAEAVDSGVSLSWTAPAEDADSVTGYEVLRAVGEGEMATLVADTASTDTTYTDATATGEGETYAYRVKAIRGQARSQGSNRVSLVPVEPPATPENLKPTNLTFEIREDGVTLAWDVPAADADSVTGYRVVRRRPNQGENEWLVWKWDTGSTETTYRDGYAQTHGEFYMYRVRALRGDDYSKMSNRVDVRRPQATPQTAEWAPSNLKAQMYFEVALGEEGVTTQVKLTWDAPAEGVEWVRGYEVQRATCDGDFITLAADTGSTDISYADATAEAGESYTYRVRARRPQGLSLTSNTWTLLLPGGTGESDCAVPLGAPETEPVGEEEDVTYAFSQHDTPLVKNTGQTSNSIGDVLDSTTIKAAQQFTTGAEANGYTLSSIGIDFHRIFAISSAGGQLVVTLNAVASNGNPGDSLCTLSDPATFTSLGVQTFGAPTGCPTLAVSTTYFVVIERVANDGNAIELSHTQSNNEDTGGAAGWSIANGRRFVGSSRTWTTRTSDPYQIEVRGVVRTTFDHSTQEFNTLSAAGNRPYGFWSDGTTMWVTHSPNYSGGDTSSPKLFAYNMATKARDSAKDFNTLDAAGNGHPRGLWSDGTTMWVTDHIDHKAYAYNMDTKARTPGEDFNTPNNGGTHGIWSGGTAIWVANHSFRSISAYDFESKERRPDEDFKSDLFFSAGVRAITGIWSDGTTMFVADSVKKKIFAFWLSTKLPDPDRDINFQDVDVGVGPSGIWSYGSTMWVSSAGHAKIYAFELPDESGPPPDTLSVEHVTDTTALVKVDIEELARIFGSAEPAVSVSVLGTLSSATMYVHPDGGYARFLLLGLRPETQYTVIANYGITTRFDLGDAGREVFRTDYARLAGIETSGLTHTEATVTVSLNGDGLDRGCCFRFYPHSNKGEAERDYTFYLRHKPSDEDDWSETVELTFSDFAADVRLTGLDPDTAYDVEVAETADFMPPQGSAGSYTGTLTVGADTNEFSGQPDSGIGFDQAGFGGFIDPYGSLSPTTFKLGGVDYGIVELLVRVPSFLIDVGDFGKLFLKFDRALPDDIAFTLTLGTEAFNSSDATVDGNTYSWAGGPSWSVDDSVTVELDFTGVVPFREGTTLEGAFSTPPLPETLAFEAEMTVHVGGVLDGYHSTQGSISSNTFAVGGVQYTVRSVGFLKVSANEFELTVTSALPFDSFTLTLGSTELLSSNATVTVHNNGDTDYIWSGTNPSWSNNDKVAVKLDIGLIDICDRSPAVAHAIREATPSFDFCHMTSPIDLANLTELDLPGGRGTGLKAGDFEGLSGLTRLDLSHYILSLQQLPVGVFDGLDSLTHLDLSHTDLLKLDLGVFEGLDNLEVLDLSDTSLQRRTVPVGVFDDVPNLEVLRLSNESSIGGYRTHLQQPRRRLLQGPGRPAGAGPGGQQPAPGLAPVPPAPDQPGDVQRPALHPARGPACELRLRLGADRPRARVLQDVLCGHLEVGRPHRGERHHRLPRCCATSAPRVSAATPNRSQRPARAPGPLLTAVTRRLFRRRRERPERLLLRLRHHRRRGQLPGQGPGGPDASVPDLPGSEHAHAARLPVRPFRREEPQRLQGAPAVERPSSQHHRLRDLLPGVELGRLADHRGQRRKRAGVRPRIGSGSALLGAKDRREHVPVQRVPGPGRVHRIHRWPGVPHPGVERRRQQRLVQRGEALPVREGRVGAAGRQPRRENGQQQRPAYGDL